MLDFRKKIADVLDSRAKAKMRECCNKQYAALASLTNSLLLELVGDATELGFKFNQKEKVKTDFSFNTLFDMVSFSGLGVKLAEVNYNITKPDEETIDFIFRVPSGFDGRAKIYDGSLFGEGWSYLDKHGFDSELFEQMLKTNDPTVIIKYFSWTDVKVHGVPSLMKSIEKLKQAMGNWQYVFKLMKKVNEWDLPALKQKLQDIKQKQIDLENEKKGIWQVHGAKLLQMGRALPFFTPTGDQQC